MLLLTVDETAKLLKVNPVTVRRYINDGRLAAVRVGRNVRVRQEAVEALLTPITPAASHASPPSDGTSDRPSTPARVAVPRLTDEQKEAILAAIEQSKRERIALAEKYKDVPLPSSLDLIYEAREQRTRELS